MLPRQLARIAVFVAAVFPIVSCVPSEISDMAGPSNPNVDTSIIPKEGPNGKWGYVDRNGKWLIEPQFWQAEGFKDDLFDAHNGEAIVWYEDKFCYIDKSGKIISEVHPNRH